MTRPPPIEPGDPAAQAERQLPKVLRFFDLSVLASASMGPAYSLAATMGPIVAAAGGAAPLAIVALSAIMLCMAVAFSSMTRVAPSAGSSYSWIRLAFGRYPGAYGGWLLILSNFFATLSTAVPAGIYTLALIAPKYAHDTVWTSVVGAMWVAVSAVLLYVGIRPTAIITFIALAFEFVVLGASAVAALIVTPHVVATASDVGGSTLIPVTFGGFVSAMTLGVWMSDGWEVSASTSEEVDGDERAAGRSGIAGLLATTAILVFCTIAYLHLGTPRGFADNSADSLVYVGDLLGGGGWHLMITAAVMLSTLTTLWTTMLYLSRSGFAMGRDGVLPRFLGTLDRRQEPFWSLAVVGVLSTALTLLTAFSSSAKAQLDTVVNASSMFLGLLFAFSAAASVKHFWRDPTARWAGVIIPAVGTIALLGVLVATVLLESATNRWYALGGAALGVPFMIWRVRTTDRRIAPA